MTLAERLRDAELQRRIAAAYAANQDVEGRRLNLETGLARGGSAISGGAMKEDAR